jgi:transposase-like protein
VDGEIVVERRRQWAPEAKAALMAEVEAEGGQVLVVARRHGISKSLLYNWRSAWRAAGLAARARAIPPTEFVQVGVVAEIRQKRAEGLRRGPGRQEAEFSFAPDSPLRRIRTAGPAVEKRPF